MIVVDARDLVKSYGRTKILKNMTFSIEENTITGVVGRNGAGKTTLLKIIAGYLRETSGQIQVFSRRPFNNLFVSANSIFIDDQISLPDSLTLNEILETAGSFYKNWNHHLAKGLLDYFSLRPDQYHRNLSKGMKSTFHMILGLASRSPLTIFDEPTSGMDAAIRKDFYRALLKDYLAHPRTILLSSHHLQEIEDLLENVLLIDDGKALLHISADDLKKWAIGLKGKRETIERCVKNREILHEQELGFDLVYTVVRNDFPEDELARMMSRGVEVSPVSSSDTCVYLTKKRKGGIDDVFRRSETV
mgnify:FL=1